jgi:hypothetical protein
MLDAVLVNIMLDAVLINIMLDAVLREYDNTARIDTMTLTQFYAYDGFIASPDHAITQHTLNALLHNFSQFGLCISMTKTELMTILGSKLIHQISDSAYYQMITKTGPTCEEKKQKINCGNCGLEVQTRSLKQHQLSKQCRNTGMNNNQQDMVCIPILEQQSETYVISMNQITHSNYPSIECPYAKNKRDYMRKHFRTRHPQDIIVIQEEGLLPQCNNCGIFQNNVHTDQHSNSKECRYHAKTKKGNRN